MAATLGWVIGALTHAPGPQAPWFAGWVRVALILYALGVFIAASHALPGRFGLGLEIALFMIFAYALGALAGGLARQGEAWLKMSTDSKPARSSRTRSGK